MRRSEAEVLALAGKVVSIIESKDLTQGQRDEVVRDALYNFSNYVNRGILFEYKDVLPSFSYIEWEEKNAVISNIQGEEFIDCLGGYGVCLLGHRHPKVVSAVQAQLGRCSLHSQELVDPLRGYLACLLAYLSPGDLQNSYLVNSGSEAVEMALKLARLVTGKPSFISTNNGFHGQTFGALSATGREVLRQPYLPLIQDFHHIPYGDNVALVDMLTELERAGKPAAAIIVEPVQGEGGVNIPPASYFPALREICDWYGCLLIADEIQTGMGRTGKLFGLDHYGVVPDIMTMGKALGGGVVPVAAVLAKAKYWEKMEKHLTILGSSTFGGNPLCCAGAIAAIKATLEEHIPEQAAEKGSYFLKGLQSIQHRYFEVITDVRGMGLLIGIEMASIPLCRELEKGFFADRILVAVPENGSRVIRLLPPATITYAQIDLVLEALLTHVKEIWTRHHVKIRPEQCVSQAARHHRL